jgi:preprotein translocase subunit SecE
MNTVAVKQAPEGGNDDRGGWLSTSRSFLTEVRNEMRRVTWPNRREVYATTVVVILVSAFFGLYLWGVDLLLSGVVNWIFRTFGA